MKLSPPKKELICQACDQDYPVWFTDNALWNIVTFNTNIHFLCLNCFAILAEKKGLKAATWYLTKK